MPILTSSPVGLVDYLETARRRVGFIEDFVNYNSVVSLQGGWMDPSLIEDNKFGVLSCTTQDTADGMGGYVATGDSTDTVNDFDTWQLGKGVTSYEALVKTPSNLSDGTDRYKIIVGMIDNFRNVSDTTINDGVYWEYIDNSSTAWRYCTSNDGTRTEQNSSTTVSTSTWYRLKIIVNADASLVEFFINGTSAGTISANIPAASGDELQIGFKIQKSLGTNARVMYGDYVAFQIDLNTWR